MDRTEAVSFPTSSKQSATGHKRRKEAALSKSTDDTVEQFKRKDIVSWVEETQDTEKQEQLEEIGVQGQAPSLTSGHQQTTTSSVELIAKRRSSVLFAGPAEARKGLGTPAHLNQRGAETSSSGVATASSGIMSQIQTTRGKEQKNGTVKHYVECGPLFETAALGTGKQATFTAEGAGGVSDYGRGLQENTEDNTTVLAVDVKANKHQIKRAVKKLSDTDVAKVNTLIRPDGEKADVQVAPGYDVANEIRVI
ncbi:hypothetical protein U0070_017698 [Myodes glareolus]|uniref:Uncharacterized protein n=1 Tax=Myodes glareolus TaxID=447135 RepID=A0AAW0K5R4_MYOGA